MMIALAEALSFTSTSLPQSLDDAVRRNDACRPQDWMENLGGSMYPTHLSFNSILGMYHM